ncbi:hypothetical protein [Anaerovorax sp. IOR16]|uniref:hypothetical protein n=1 Tax=Anaerovorax sp. IOR16 TaxID=2773458 RepID=UPI0019D11DED|nr:hypothetical protein [Anaerovorax sp. IOR16]
MLGSIPEKGDMIKSVYDTDNNGIVDNAEKLGGQLPTYYAKQSDIGDLTTLQTTDKTNVVKAVNEMQSKLYNPNLLDNAYFEIPEAIVNQKGIVSGWVTPTSLYFIDRWRSYINIANNTTYTFEPNGLGVQVSEGWGGIAQLLEFAPTEGMYTFSAIIDGVVHALTFDASTWNAQSGTTVGLTAFTYLDKKTVRILFYDTAKHITQRVKLEKGTVSTILNDPPQDFGDTLQKCQRYYRTYGSGLVGIALNSTTMHVMLNFENEMRITPNPVLLTTTINFFGTADVQATNATATFYGDKKGGALAVTGFTGLVAGNVYRSNQAGWLALDANL